MMAKAGEAFYIPKFDVKISSNFGYVFTQKAVEEVICHYEISSMSSFVLQKARRAKIDAGHGHGRRVYWEDVATNQFTVPAAAIKFDGSPFCFVASKKYECHHGKDWKEEYKARKRDENKQAGTSEHGSIGTKRRRTTQPTKKLDCPACLVVKEVVKYPDFHITENKAKGRKDASAALRKAFAKGDNITCERRYYIYLPTEEDHKGTHAMGEDDSGSQRLDPSIIKKIEDVVASHEVQTGSEMEFILKHFVQNELNLQPPPSEDNRRFYPHRKVIRFHMNKAKKSLRKHANDQENLEKLISEWKDTSTDEQQFYFRKFQKDNQGEGCTLLFVHQTTWQKNLLMKYGQEICFLDAAYKTVRYALPLFFIAVKSDTCYIVVGTFVTQDEKTDSIKEALDILKEWCPGWSPKHFMTDSTDQEISAIEQVFQGCDVLICDFHRVQAWERWASHQENGLGPIRMEVLAKLDQIAHAKSVREYAEAVESLKISSVWMSNKNLQKWFESEWLSIYKRWVWAFQQERFLLSVNSHSGIEHQSRVFKDEYVREKHKLPLSQIVKLLVREFLPDSWKKYMMNNLQASGKTQKFSINVPTYLHDRPDFVSQFCLEQLEKSKSLKQSDIKECGNFYDVRSVSRPTEYHKVSVCQPSCTCYTWRKNSLPCKHMFAVFSHTAATWQDLPEDYRSSPMVILDLAGVEVGGDLNGVEVRDDLDGVEDADFTQPMEENPGGSLSDGGSPSDGEDAGVSIDDRTDKLQQQCREVLHEIREYTFLIHDTDALEELKGTLKICLSNISQQAPQKGGLPHQPSLQKKTSTRKGPSFLKSPQGPASQVNAKETDTAVQWMIWTEGNT